ncbi:MAG: hypothetical protein HOL07_15335 [Rhodospirillaceae bacterium]|nr:hypothetical protein [Rhodospirillaceae bacterium]MBT5359713.1 hypothetical protein [Rhodospirillaceae bacterium]MBT5945836.1 hypothetical protein [Rhodospirillaceae bacterium]MBT6403486.1 hypothetical protein [Rhodospirillaceae bacterium]MBT7363405.1 hypothetical protein [Rhodospirillaceae bacterium]
MLDIPAIKSELAEHGLIHRDGFHPVPEDKVPDDPATVILVGNAGPDMWAAFDAVRNGYAGQPNPLDAWISDTLTNVAVNVGATALFPFGGPPHLPFQRWAQRAEPVHPSPVGVLIHPEFGLWHAYRGALAFTEILELPMSEPEPSPCDSCADKPCLSACPVGAFGGDAYEVPACVRHITGPDTGDCMGQGCLARRACPVGQDYVYAPAQAGFHMRAFTSAQTDD